MRNKILGSAIVFVLLCSCGAKVPVGTTKRSSPSKTTKEQELGSNLGTPLHKASTAGDYDSVIRLIKSGENVDARCKDLMNETPLMSSIGSYRMWIPESKPDHQVHTLKIVKALIEAKANLNAQDDLGNTALHIAATVKSRELMNLLIAAGASTTIKCNAGFTAEEMFSASLEIEP